MAVTVSNQLLGKAEAAAAASSAATSKSSLDKDSFLKLLTTQLSHQDPLNPMEDKEFTAQMAQFSSLEQLMNISKGIESLNKAQNNDQAVTAVSYIGKDVRADGYALGKDGTDISTMYYSLGESITDAYLNIYDQDGDLVRSVSLGSKQSGNYEYVWDGLDYNGKEAADGTYNVAIAANNMDGKPVLVQTEISGTVAGVLTENGEQYLRLKDGRVVSFANVKEVVGSGTAFTDEEESSS